MTTALAVFVRVTKPGYEGVYEERTVWPQGRQWINIKAPGSIPVPDAAMARWDAEGFVEGYPAPVEAREEGSREAYFDPTGGLIVGAAALAAMGGYKVAAGLWQAFLDLTGDAIEAIEAAVRQRKISREEAERMKIEVRRRDAELRTKGAQFDEARDWVSAKILKLMDEGKPQRQAVAIALNMARKRFPGKIPEKEAERYDILPWLHLGSNILMIEALLTAVGSQGPLGAIVDLIKKAGSLGKGLWEAVKRGLISPEQAAEVEQKAKEKEMRTESRKRQKYVGAAFGRPRRFSEARADLEERGRRRYDERVREELLRLMRERGATESNPLSMSDAAAEISRRLGLPISEVERELNRFSELRRYRSVDPLGAAVVDVLKGMEGKIATRDELVGLVSREIGASPMLVREVVRRLISEGVLWESDPGFLTIRPGLLGRIVHGIFAAEPRRSQYVQLRESGVGDEVDVMSPRRSRGPGVVEEVRVAVGESEVEGYAEPRGRRRYAGREAEAFRRYGLVEGGTLTDREEQAFQIGLDLALSMTVVERVHAFEKGKKSPEEILHEHGFRPSPGEIRAFLRPFSGGIFAESRGRSPRRYAGREAEAFRVGQAFARMSSDRSGLRSMSEVDAADVLEERGFSPPSAGEVGAFLLAVQERIADLLVPA